MRRSSSVYARSSLVASFCPSSSLASCTSTSSVGLEPAVAASRLWQIFHLSSISLMNGSRSVSEDTLQSFRLFLVVLVALEDAGDVGTKYAFVRIGRP
uniref:Putative secreted protein n=1 Tax=Anopheles marajoara TaxID=58244 RepID=A0A2M4C933_9DIPT